MECNRESRRKDDGGGRDGAATYCRAVCLESTWWAAVGGWLMVMPRGAGFFFVFCLVFSYSFLRESRSARGSGVVAVVSVVVVPSACLFLPLFQTVSSSLLCDPVLSYPVLSGPVRSRTRFLPWTAPGRYRRNWVGRGGGCKRSLTREARAEGGKGDRRC